MTLNDQKQEAMAQSIVATSSNHHEAMMHFFVTRILPRLPQGSSTKLLDIGAGPGVATRLLHPHFSSTVVVEPNPDYFDFQAPNLTVLRSDFLRACEASPDLLAPGSFDFILCSHVMYHLDSPATQAWLRAMLLLLKPVTGVALIIVTGSRGPGHKMQTAVARHDPSGDIQEAAGALKRAGEGTCVPFTVDVQPSTSKITSPDQEALVQMLLYFIQYNCHSAEALARVGEEGQRRAACEALRERVDDTGKKVWVFDEHSDNLFLTRL